MSMSSTSRASAACRSGHDGPAEAGLGGRQDGGQDAADGPDPSVQAELAQQHGAGQLTSPKTSAAASTAATIARS